MVASGDFMTTSKNLDLFPPVRSKHDSKADGFCWKLDTCWRFCMQPSIAQWIVQHNVSLDPAVFQFILVSNMFSDKMRGTRNRHSLAGSTPNNCQVFFVLTILQHPFKSIRIAGCRIVSAGVFANIFFFTDFGSTSRKLVLWIGGFGYLGSPYEWDCYLSRCWFPKCLFSPLFGEDFQFDQYFSINLNQPPTSYGYPDSSPKPPTQTISWFRRLLLQRFSFGIDNGEHNGG